MLSIMRGIKKICILQKILKKYLTNGLKYVIIITEKKKEVHKNENLCSKIF